MLKKLPLQVIIMIGIFLIMISSSAAQWPTDPDSNMVICDRDGEQAIPLIAPTSDGGCYVCWYDNTSGNYNMYLQKLNAAGEAEWQPGGILISNHTQDSWLTDYMMIADHEDYAVIAFNDLRNGGDWDIYAYRISPDGEFFWGPDGVTLSDNDAYEAIPVVTATTNNNIVVAWIEEDIIHIYKLTPDGQDCWLSGEIIMTSDYGMTSPKLCPGDNESFILQVMVHSGPDYWNPYDIVMYKFSDDGSPLWGENGVAVTDAGGIAAFMVPNMMTDGYGGAYAYWYDSRIANELHVYVQHINGDGNTVWETNGVRISNAPAQFQMNPGMTFFPESGNVMVFYKASDVNQSYFGLGGQMLSAMGQRLWGDNGILFLPLSNQGRDFPMPFAYENDAILLYTNTPVGDIVHTSLEAMRINIDGEQVWTESPVIMSSPAADKIHIVSTMTSNNQAVAVWEDDRSNNSDIYLQNVNPDGTLGPYQTAIDENNRNLPAKFALISAYPNPFNATTTISYNLSAAGSVTLDIYDLLGRKVANLVNEYQTPGEYGITWHADKVSSGVYFVRLQAGNDMQSRKLVLLK